MKRREELDRVQEQQRQKSQEALGPDQVSIRQAQKTEEKQAPDTEDRLVHVTEEVASSLLGLAVGDALGVPLEFLGQEEVRSLCVEGYLTEGRHGSFFPEGSFSDDTSMTIAAMDAIIQDRGKIDYDHVMRHFLAWWYGREAVSEGGRSYSRYSSREFPFGLGCICGEAMANYLRGASALSAGPTEYMSNGNGSLMRIYPFSAWAIYHGLSDSEMAELLGNGSRLTHGAEISRMACLIYTLLLREILGGKSFREAFLSAVSVNYASWFSPETLNAFGRLLDPSGRFEKVPESQIRGEGYVLDSLEVAVWSLLHTESYRDAILTAINFGYDTDTNASITGALAGALYGKRAIPEAWLRKLERRSYLERMAGRFAKVLISETSPLLPPEREA